MTTEREHLLLDDNGEMYVNVPVKVASKYLNISYKSLYEMLKQDKCPFGTSVQTEKGVWVFNIPCERLIAYARGTDLSLNSNLSLLNDMVSNLVTALQGTTQWHLELILLIMQ